MSNEINKENTTHQPVSIESATKIAANILLVIAALNLSTSMLLPGGGSTGEAEKTPPREEFDTVTGRLIK
jgi:hypothetical protein